MKNKIFTLTIFSALALLMFVGMASAEIEYFDLYLDGAGSSSNTPISGDSDSSPSFSIMLQNLISSPNLIYVEWRVASTNDYATVTSDNSAYAYDAISNYTVSGFSFDMPDDVGSFIVYADIYSDEDHQNQIGTTDERVNVYYENTDYEEEDVEGCTDPDANNYNPDATTDDGSCTYDATGGEPEEITECALIGNPDNDLKIEIKDIKVTGLGDDDKWAPFDEIEIEIKVENKNDDYKIRDIEVNWGLYDSSNDDWYIDDEESDFNLKDNEDKTITIKFKLDEDIEDLENYDTFYVWVNNAYLDNTDTDEEIDICASDSRDIDFYIEDFMILDNVQLPETISCSSDIQLTADVWNIGDRDQEGVWALVKNQELGINEKVTLGDIDSFDSVPLEIFFTIPDDAKESVSSYYLDIYIYDEDDDLFEAEFDKDEDSKFSIPFKIEDCSIVPGSDEISITASLASDSKAGEPMTVNALITNNGDSGTYVVKVSGFDSWATADSTQTPVVLAKGESKEIPLTLNINEDASGNQMFSIEILSGADVVKTQPVSVSVEAKSGSSFLTGAAIGSNKYLWGIGILNVILVIIIIIVAIRVSMK